MIDVQIIQQVSVILAPPCQPPHCPRLPAPPPKPRKATPTTVITANEQSPRPAFATSAPVDSLLTHYLLLQAQKQPNVSMLTLFSQTNEKLQSIQSDTAWRIYGPAKGLFLGRPVDPAGNFDGNTDPQRTLCNLDHFCADMAVFNKAGRLTNYLRIGEEIRFLFRTNRIAHVMLVGATPNESPSALYPQDYALLLNKIPRYRWHPADTSFTLPPRDQRSAAFFKMEGSPGKEVVYALFATSLSAFQEIARLLETTKDAKGEAILQANRRFQRLLQKHRTNKNFLAIPFRYTLHE